MQQARRKQFMWFVVGFLVLIGVGLSVVLVSGYLTIAQEEDARATAGSAE